MLLFGLLMPQVVIGVQVETGGGEGGSSGGYLFFHHPYLIVRAQENHSMKLKPLKTDS